MKSRRSSLASGGIVLAAVLMDAALWTAGVLVLLAPLGPPEVSDDEIIDLEVAISRIDDQHLPIIDAPDNDGELPPIPHALAQHDFDAPIETRRPTPSGSIIRPRATRGRKAEAGVKPRRLAAREMPVDPAPPNVSTTASPDRAIEAAATASSADRLPLIEGSDDVPAELPLGATNAVDTRASALAAYLDEIRRAVRLAWRPSQVYARTDPAVWNGTLADRRTELRVRVRDDGTLQEVKVIQPSGMQPLDEEAASAFVRAQPFAPPPEEVLDAEAGLSFRFGLHLDLARAHFIRAVGKLLRTKWSSGVGRGATGGDRLTVVRLRVRPDGSLADATVEIASRLSALNNALVAAAREVGQFPRPPEGLKGPDGMAQLRAAIVVYPRTEELRVFTPPRSREALLPELRQGGGPR